MMSQSKYFSLLSIVR